MEQKTLGTLIRERRTELGLTQEQLAERVGMGVRQSEISRLEHDGIALPRRSRMEEIAAALEVSIGDLLVTTGWMDDENRASLLPDPAPGGNGGGRLAPPGHEPDPAGADELATAIASLEAAREMMAQSVAMIDTAEEAISRAANSLYERGSPRSAVGLAIGVIKDWETSTALTA